MNEGLDEWLRKLQSVLAAFCELDFGYPLGENKVRAPTTREPSIPQELRAFYQVCDGVSLPDVHVGYFIEPASRLKSAAQRGEPVLVRGTRSFAVIPFGSDGGGGRFVLEKDEGAVWYLPSSGAVHDGVYVADGGRSIPVKLAASFQDFLWRLVGDVEAFIQGDPAHKFMDR